MRACVDGGGVAAPEEASGLVIPWKLRAHVGWQPCGLLDPRTGLLGHGQKTGRLWCPVARMDGTSEPKVGRLATVWCPKS